MNEGKINQFKELCLKHNAMKLLGFENQYEEYFGDKRNSYYPVLL